MLLIAAGCAQGPKNTVMTHEFGPYFLPANECLNAISINYFTERELPTSVFFSMVGDIDWLRCDSRLASYHRMVFSGLEESAVYQFRVNSLSASFSERSYIKTPPYGSNYKFDFAVVSINSPLELDKSPYFLILLSKKPSVGEDEFSQYYSKNKKILSSTILVPLFDINIGGETYSLSRGGFFILKYKTANIILLYKDFSDLGRLARTALDCSSDNNYIVASISDQAALLRLKAEYHSRVKAIFAFNGDSEFNSEWITVEQKNKFALNN